MRLRYFRLRDYPPIQNTAVHFSSGSPLQRECAIRFVVGLNGSGKSHFLRAIAEVFLTFSDNRKPNFPFYLIYEMGKRSSPRHLTIVVDFLGENGAIDWWRIEDGGSPYFADDASPDDFENALQSLRIKLIEGWVRGETLTPTQFIPRVLTYTTGDDAPWLELWHKNTNVRTTELISKDNENDISEFERPLGWTIALERQKIQAESQETLDLFELLDLLEIEDDSKNSSMFSSKRPIFFSAILLKCALLAVTLPLVFGKQENQEITALKALLLRGGWKEPVTLAFHGQFNLETWTQNVKRIAKDWYANAGEVITVPSTDKNQNRILYFDLEGNPDQPENQSNKTQGEALKKLLGGDEATPFQRFSSLADLFSAGVFEDVSIYLQKPDLDKQGVLSYADLSDGEQMILGRMALFHLLEGQSDTLLLLDEPETHFNDRWKREIVDIIDDAIGKTANDVLISTHSSIVLTDVFNDEIVFMDKGDEGARALTVNSNTFAADPSEIMMQVFKAPDSVGKRAQEFIEGMLEKTTGTPEDIQRVRELVDRLGSGFYRSELRTLLNQWEKDA